MKENKIRIFDHPWHLGHQFEQIKFTWAKWSWLFNHRRDYSDRIRGNMEQYFDWVPYYEPGKYDVAILHLDQQCVEETIYDRGKGSMYRNLNKVITDIPKIVIMHGTPHYPEKFETEGEIIAKVKNLIGDNYMVCNSHRAKVQWGFGKTIIHGMDWKEWFDLPKEPRVVTMISPGGLPSYYDRPFLDHIREALAEKDINHCHITVDFHAKDWDEYRNFIGRSLIYLNPTLDSPMPRARTEAMFSGCCVLTTPWQDADRFIKDGVNGILIKRNPQWVADKIEYLLNHYSEACKIGQEGKKTAYEIFSWDRYQQEWKDYINFVINDFKEKQK